MNLHELTEKVLAVRAQYAEYERKNSFNAWGPKEAYTGLVSDVGDLGRLVLAKEGYRKMPNPEENMSHELAELLYNTLLLAHYYEIDLEKAFDAELARIEKKLSA